MISSIKEGISAWIESCIKDYGWVLAIFTIGFVAGWKLKFFLSEKRYMEQVNLRIKEKDNIISDLKTLISERLKNVAVEEKDKTFFKRLKNFFSINKKNK